MILKEAFRHQKFLDELINRCVACLYSDFIMETTDTHMYNEVDSTMENMVVKAKKVTFRNDNIKPNTVVSFLMDLYDQKYILTKAIEESKRKTNIDIDVEIAMNKLRYNIGDVLKYMSAKQSYEESLKGNGHRFNVEGNQTSYTYTINRVSTIDYDRKIVKKLSKKLFDESNNVSSSIDFANVTVEVNYTPKYDLDDSFEDCIEKFM